MQQMVTEIHQGKRNIAQAQPSLRSITRLDNTGPKSSKKNPKPAVKLKLTLRYGFLAKNKLGLLINNREIVMKSGS